MVVHEVSSDIFWVGAIDKESQYFDNLMPLPAGTSYNAYIVRGNEKVALVDSVEPRFKDILFEQLREAQITNIDYIISHHAEQDHSGCFPELLQQFPTAVIVTNTKCKEFLQQEHHINDDKFLIIKDKDTLSLGDKTLQFFLTPWVHWPETMMTYVQEDNVLFTCDLYGAHLAFDTLWVENEEQVRRAAKRYYAEIMIPFAKMVAKHTKFVRQLNPKVIAPSHGPVHGTPDTILQLHEKWTSTRCKKRVIIAYVSMHGSTKRMADHLIWKLKEQGVAAEIFDIMETDVGEIIMKLINTSTFILCSPGYLGGLHPAAAHLLFLINGFKPSLKFAGFMSSHGWDASCGVDQFQNLLRHVNPEFLQPVLITGHPRDDEFRLIDTLVEEIKQKHQ